MQHRVSHLNMGSTDRGRSNQMTRCVDGRMGPPRMPMDLIGAFYQNERLGIRDYDPNYGSTESKSYGTTSQNHHWSLVLECSRYPSTKSPFLRVKSLLFLGKCVNWSSKPIMYIDLDHVSRLSPVSFSTSHATQRGRAASWSTKRSSNMSERSIESISNTSIHAEPPGAIAIAAIEKGTELTSCIDSLVVCWNIIFM